jgi:hypothetical protein
MKNEFDTGESYTKPGQIRARKKTGTFGGVLLGESFWGLAGAVSNRRMVFRLCGRWIAVLGKTSVVDTRTQRVRMPVLCAVLVLLEGCPQKTSSTWLYARFAFFRRQHLYTVSRDNNDNKATERA